MRPKTASTASGRAVVFVSLAALVFFSRAWLIRAWGSPLPFWDQWDAEAIDLYGPWINGTLHWTDFLKAQNEHRIVLTRIADLVLFQAYGGWNPWAQVLLNAVLHAAAAIALVGVFWKELTIRGRGAFVAGVAILFTATCGWQNALYGFQSQVYFANLFSIGAIAGLCAAAPLRGGWWLGLTAAMLACLSNAGGVLAAVAALMVGLISAARTPRTASEIRTWLALGLPAGIAATALLSGTGAPQHAAFHAKNLHEFLAVFSHCLAWPWINAGPCCLVTQLPLAWLVFDRRKQKVPLNAAERCALAFGLFWILQAAAIGYTRGAVLPESRPISRYQDPFLLGAAGQLFALLAIVGRYGRPARIAGLIWGAVAAGGLIGLTEANFSVHLPFKRAQDKANLAIVRDYAATGDPAAFTRDPNFSGPHPDPHIVQRVIDDPALRSTLPVEILAPEVGGTSRLPWVIRHSPALTGASGILLLLAVGHILRKRSEGPNPTVPAKPGAR